MLSFTFIFQASNNVTEFILSRKVFGIKKMKIRHRTVIVRR